MYSVRWRELQSAASITSMASSASASVPRVTLLDSYEHFETRYAAQNSPVCIPNATANWKSADEWVTSDGKPDVDRLVSLFGEHVVTVHSKTTGKPREMTVAEYAEYWKNKCDELLYLKDWPLLIWHSMQAYHCPALGRGLAE